MHLAAHVVGLEQSFDSAQNIIKIYRLLHKDTRESERESEICLRFSVPIAFFCRKYFDEMKICEILVM